LRGRLINNYSFDFLCQSLYDSPFLVPSNDKSQEELQMATRKPSPPAKKHTRKSSVASAAPTTAEPVFAASPAVQISPRVAANPVFAEPQSMPDPSVYKVAHASDTAAYDELDRLQKLHQFNPLPFRVMQGAVEPVMTLGSAYGSVGKKVEQTITKAGQIVFHSAGDTGATKAVQDEYNVVDKMVADFSEKDPAAVPQFFYHLGDIVYSFGEHTYYYDQFYDAFRNYPAPIFAVPGNHDGLVVPVAPAAGQTEPTPGDPRLSLSGFYANFCTPRVQHSSDAVGIARTTMTQPGVYFTLEAPLVRILGIYSNMLENPGVISSTVNPTTGKASFPDISDAQLTYLEAALTRVKKEKFAGAVILAVHHPPYTFGRHITSLVMLKEIDAICDKVGVWPHAVLSGHAHNYQRYTRTMGKRQIPYVVCGNGGHPPLQKLSVDTTLRTPISMPGFAQPERNDTVTLDNYEFKSFGYLRIVVDTKQLRIEFHPQGDGVTAKTPDDFVTVLLADGTLVHYIPPSDPLHNQI
jgi:Calcineurin-like phosphoesterase